MTVATRIAAMERDVLATSRDVNLLRALIATPTTKRYRKLARIEAPVSDGYNTFNIKFLDGKFTEAAGNQMPNYSNRQEASHTVAHNLGAGLPAVGNIVEVTRWSNRWWFETGGDSPPSFMATEYGIWAVGGPGTVDPITNVGPAFGLPEIEFLGDYPASGYVLYDPVLVPNGATINSATLDIATLRLGLAWAQLFIPFTLQATFTARGILSGEDIDDAAEYTTNAQWDAATRTTANVSLEYDTEVDHTNPFLQTSEIPANDPLSLDVTAIVQEIVNRAGWASGNAMQFLFDENGSTKVAPHGVIAYMHDDATTPFGSPTLNIAWS